MRINKIILLSTTIFFANYVSASPSLAMDQDAIIKRLDALEKENASLRQRLNRIESVEPKNKEVTKLLLPAAQGESSRKTRKTVAHNFDPVLDTENVQPNLSNSFSKENPNTYAYNQHHFELNASFIGLQPSTSNLVYATEISPYPVPTPNWNDRTISPGFTPAFSIGAKYMPNPSNDIEINWTHLNTTSTASMGVNPKEQMIGPSWLIGPTAANYGSAYGKGTFTYDAVNLEAGHTFCADCTFQFRPFGGVQFADLSQSMTGEFSNALGAQLHDKGLNWMSTNASSQFTGAGPRLGLGGSYNWSDFQFIGKMGAGLLIGTQQSSYNLLTTCTDGCPSALTYNGTNIIGNSQAYTSPNTTQVIPTIDAKLATAYAFAPTSQGQFKVEVGWQAAAYFNTVSQYNITNTVPAPSPATPTGIYLAGGQHSLNNFTVQGPYITGRWAY